MRSVFKFFTRPGCHLCDEARPVVQRAVRDRGGIIEEIDIDSDDTLTRDFGLRVPVLLDPDESVIAEGWIEPASLRRALAKWPDKT